MTLLAHAITAAPPATLSPEGLRGRPLAWSEASAGLGLWSTDWTPDLKLERPDALEHHRLVERICAAQPCLPVRFGTAFANADAARASLDKRAETLHAALARVSGKSELALTLLWRDKAAVTPRPVTGPGRRYMEERRAELGAREAKRARAETMVERIVTELAIERPLVWHETCTTANVANRACARAQGGARPDRLRVRRRHHGPERAVAAVHVREDRMTIDAELDDLRREVERLRGILPDRVDVDPDAIENGLAKLVLTLVEFLRQLLERQAVRRMEGGSLSDEEVERMGVALMRLEEKVHEMARTFGIDPTELNLEVGPLGRLI